MRQFSTLFLAALLSVLATATQAQQQTKEVTLEEPIQSAQEMEQRAAKLLGSGEAGILAVAAQLVPMGAGDDNDARYALSGLAKYAGAPGHETERAEAEQAFIGALAQAQDPEVRSFLMSLLQWMGGDASVPALAAYLHDPQLVDPAAQALEAIGSEAACTALAEALLSAEGSRAVTLLTALGSARCDSVVKSIRPFTNSMESAVKEAALSALANVGDTRSTKTLLAAENPDLALRLARNLEAAGKSGKAARVAKQVLKNTPGGAPSHTAALTLLADAGANKAIKPLEEALQSDQQDLRVAAIRSLAKMGTPKAQEALERALGSENVPLRADLLRILGQLQFASALPVAQESLKHPELPVRLAAIDALVHLAGRDAYATLVERRGDDADAHDEEAVALDAAIAATRPPVGPPLGVADAEGFVPLFNGRDFTGWEGDSAGYAIEDGAIVWRGGKKLYTLEDFDNFTLRFAFRLTEGANNGIGLRMGPGTHAGTQGMEIQILDDDAEKHADLKPYQYCGAIYGVAAPERGHTKPAGEWNEMEITAKGPQVTVKINDATVVDVNIEEIHAQGTPDEKDHPGLKRKSGRIALLGHGTELAFKNLRVKRL